MQQDHVRVLRIIEYTGPRDLVERQVERSLHGTKVFGPSKDREVTIRVATLGEYPEVLARVENDGTGLTDAYDGNIPQYESQRR